MTSLRVAIYARVSSDPQASGSIASQIAALEARVSRRGSAWSLITVSSMTATAEPL